MRGRPSRCWPRSRSPPAAQAAPAIRSSRCRRRMAQPQDIVEGLDGNMWFTERGANKIGRISGPQPGRRDRVPDRGDGQRAGHHRGGARRGALVHGARQQQHRAHAAGQSRRRHPLHRPGARLAARDRGRPRRQPVGGRRRRGTARTCSASRRPARRWGRRFRSRRASTPRGIARGADGNMWVANFSTPGSVGTRHHGRHADGHELPGPGGLADRRDRRRGRQHLVRGPGHDRRQGSRRAAAPPRSRARESTRSGSRSGPTGRSGSRSSRRAPSAASTAPAPPAT